MESSVLEPRGEELGAGGHGSPWFLDRTIDLGAVSWVTIAWLGALVAAVAIRLTSLDLWALAPGEARHAYESFTLYQGRSLEPGEELPTTAPLFLLLQAFGYFLFGTTDAIARIMPALAGVAMVPLVWSLRPFVGRHAALGMSVLVALSPTLVYASRTGNNEIFVATFALAAVAAIVRIGLPGANDGSVRRWCVLSGVAVGCLIASGPSSISVVIAIAIGGLCELLSDRGGDDPGALRSVGIAIARVPGTLASIASGLLATLLILFTRLFSEIGAVSGLGHTLADWGRLVFSAPGTVPIQFFVLASLLYEILAVVFAITAVYSGSSASEDRYDPELTVVGGRLRWPFFGGWFAVMLLLFGFSSGRGADDAVQVALPLVLLAGVGLGDVLEGINWRDTLRGAGGLLALTYLGLVIGLIAVGILASRIDNAESQGEAISQMVFVLVLVVVPLSYAAYVLIRAKLDADAGVQTGLLALLVLGVLLGAFTLRSSIMLNFFNADEGNELLAQRTATGAVRPLVDRLYRLSRDATLTRESIRDTTGGRSLNIALDERVEWPFRWYFRDFPNLQIYSQGTAAGAGAEVVIAPTEEGLAEAGYTPRSYPYLNRIPAAYNSPQAGDILGDIVIPSRWIDGSHFLLFRDLGNPPAAETVTVAFNAELASRITPNSGPFNLFDRAGAGSQRGKFSNPRGIAVNEESGEVYVVDMGNLRVERFDADGQFIGLWGAGEEGGGIEFGSVGGLGPTGVAVGPDGLVYVADTWNHRVIAIDDSGAIVREIGSGEQTDLGNAPDEVNQSPGLFFGPRAIAIFNNEIFVVDTGNERVQVFGMDGTFHFAFGGYGEEPGQLREPVGIAIGPDGLVYIADSDNARISVFTTTGQAVRQFPVPAWTGGQYVEPYLTFGHDGLLYATSRITASVEVFQPDGTPVDSLRDIGGNQLQSPIGIATAPDGSILIGDSERSAVFRYVPASTTIENPGSETFPGQNGEGSPIADDQGGIDVLPQGAAGAAPTSAAPPPPPPASNGSLSSSNQSP